MNIEQRENTLDDEDADEDLIKFFDDDDDETI